MIRFPPGSRRPIALVASSNAMVCRRVVAVGTTNSLAHEFAQPASHRESTAPCLQDDA